MGLSPQMEQRAELGESEEGESLVHLRHHMRFPFSCSPGGLPKSMLGGGSGN